MQRPRLAFTLLELLVVIGVITLLTAILLPALQSGRKAALDLKCRTNMHSIATEFVLFAEPSSGRPRGDSEQFGPNKFRLEDFQESIYRISEFWEGPTGTRQSVNASRQPLMCPAGSDTLDRRANVPCDQGAVGPQKNISIGFNKRLSSRSRLLRKSPVLSNVYLTSGVLNYPDVPLLLDVDGEAADQRGVIPYYTAPPIPKRTKEPDAYDSGKFWFPGKRHRDRTNVGFIGGHVLSTTDPLGEAWWRWDFSPEPAE